MKLVPIKNSTWPPEPIMRSHFVQISKTFLSETLYQVSDYRLCRASGYFSGWSGYACNDGSDIVPGHEQLTELVLLVVSHVMFIPAIILALYRTHYVEGFVYFYTMFFSAVSQLCYLSK